MNTRYFSSLIPLAIAFLFFAGCGDSKNPLSDPQNSKQDARLVGVWRVKGNEGETTYCHLGHVGDSLPESVMRAITVTYSGDGELQPPGELLIFPTTLGPNTYLNMTEGKEQQIKLLKEKGWRSVESYLLLKYNVEGDVLSVWPMDGDAKKAAIAAGKIKGVIEKEKVGTKVRFTDTTENVARFVAGAGDGLFAKKPLRLERVK